MEPGTTIKRGIVIYTLNEDGSWTRTIDEAARAAIIEKLNTETK